MHTGRRSKVTALRCVGTNSLFNDMLELLIFFVFGLRHHTCCLCFNPDEMLTESMHEWQLFQLSMLCPALSEKIAHSTVYLHLSDRWAVAMQLDCWLRWWYTVEWAVSSESEMTTFLGECSASKATVLWTRKRIWNTNFGTPFLFSCC